MRNVPLIFLFRIYTNEIQRSFLSLAGLYFYFLELTSSLCAGCDPAVSVSDAVTICKFTLKVNM
jgi:hypothetical protein